MRPLNIKISAFGPYAGYIEIPMQELGDKGLYLITGDTGAGKTTIFDAICFALFGEPSGRGRDANMFRSKYSEPGVPTEVELTFSHKGKTYTVRRNPEYMRPAKKGGGETKQLADANLLMPDGSVITKVKNVTAKVEEILGINRDQFSQIAMIAQGDFMKLLLASTEDRIKIFRDLFKTERFQVLQGSLDQSFRDLYGSVQDGRKSIEQYIGGIQADRDSVLSIDTQRAQKGEMTTEDVILLLDKLIDSDSEGKEKLDEELGEVSEKLGEVNQRIGTAEAVDKARRSMEEARARLEQEKPKASEYEALFQKAREDLKGKSDIEKKANILETEFAKYDRTDELKREVEALKKSLEGRQKKLSGDTQEKDRKNKELADLKKEQELLTDTSAEIEKLKAALKDAEVVETDIRELSGAYNKHLEDRKVLEARRDIYIKENEEFAARSSCYESMDQLYRDAKAGILARGLAEGCECPVCGSTHHPRLAELPHEAPTENELELAKKEAEKARRARDKRAEEISGLAKALETVEEELKKKCQKHLGSDELTGAAAAIEEKLREIDERKQSLACDIKKKEAEKKRGEEIAGITSRLFDEIAGLDEGIADIKAGMSAETTRIELAEGELGTLLNNLQFPDKKDAEKERERLLSEAKVLQDAFDAADRKLKEQNRMITELETKVSENQKTIEKSGSIDAASEREAQKLLTDKQEELMERGRKISGRLDNNRRTRDSIIRKSSNMAELEKRLQWIKTLSDTANGKLAGKDKVKLETYVQTTYFDRIIERANLRLITMTGGQYELVRLKESGNVKSQSGLDLGVIDHYNGSQRSVRTLSGGESFMASLSLALGLSDEVQSSAGGIQIDTMFVDEGFGSLDPEALDMAYRALGGLTEGNRLVGIISHVPDLKERIDRQIVVTRQRTGGSTVRLV